MTVISKRVLLRRNNLSIKPATLHKIMKLYLIWHPYKLSKNPLLTQSDFKRRVAMFSFLSICSESNFSNLAVSDEANFSLGVHVFNSKTHLCCAPKESGRSEHFFRVKTVRKICFEQFTLKILCLTQFLLTLHLFSLSF